MILVMIKTIRLYSARARWILFAKGLKVTARVEITVESEYPFLKKIHLAVFF